IAAVREADKPHFDSRKDLDTLQHFHLLKSADEARHRRDWGLAQAQYGKFLELEPQRSDIWLQCGHAAKEAGEFETAEAAYRRSLALNGSDADAHVQLGHLLKLAGRFADAKAAYEAALVHEPAHAGARAELAAWQSARAL